MINASFTKRCEHGYPPENCTQCEIRELRSKLDRCRTLAAELRRDAEGYEQDDLGGGRLMGLADAAERLEMVLK